MKTIQAVYENGVFRPLEPVNLPEACKVRLHAESSEAHERAGEAVEAAARAADTEIHGMLRQRFRSGKPDLSARHNEHQA